MDTPKLLNLIGLALNCVSPFPLAYDVIRGPGSKFQLDVARTKLKNAERLRDYLIASNAKIAQPPYTADDIAKLNNEANQRYVEAKNALQPERDYYEHHPDRAINWALVGLGMLIVGFALQFYAALVSP